MDLARIRPPIAPHHPLPCLLQTSSMPSILADIAELFYRTTRHNSTRLMPAGAPRCLPPTAVAS
uniref:Uncharacterized protein n=1 Tax=Oryza barthii TaxID=65489 RepID=A0A0D3GDF9_9ORYZ